MFQYGNITSPGLQLKRSLEPHHLESGQLHRVSQFYGTETIVTEDNFPGTHAIGFVSFDKQEATGDQEIDEGTQ